MSTNKEYCYTDYHFEPALQQDVFHPKPAPRIFGTHGFFGSFNWTEQFFGSGRICCSRGRPVRFGKSARKYPWAWKTVWSGVTGTEPHSGTNSYRLPILKHWNLLTLRSGPEAQSGIHIRSPRKICYNFGFRRYYPEIKVNGSNKDLFLWKSRMAKLCFYLYFLTTSCFDEILMKVCIVLNSSWAHHVLMWFWWYSESYMTCSISFIKQDLKSFKKNYNQYAHWMLIFLKIPAEISLFPRLPA